MVFALKGDPEASWYQAQSAIDDLLLAGRHDAIEALGKKWEYRSDSLSESTSRTAYAELVRSKSSSDRGSLDRRPHICLQDRPTLDEEPPQLRPPPLGLGSQQV